MRLKALPMIANKEERKGRENPEKQYYSPRNVCTRVKKLLKHVVATKACKPIMLFVTAVKYYTKVLGI